MFEAKVTGWKCQEGCKDVRQPKIWNQEKLAVKANEDMEGTTFMLLH